MRVSYGPGIICFIGRVIMGQTWIVQIFYLHKYETGKNRQIINKFKTEMWFVRQSGNVV